MSGTPSRRDEEQTWRRAVLAAAGIGLFLVGPLTACAFALAGWIFDGLDSSWRDGLFFGWVVGVGMVIEQLIEGWRMRRR